MTDQIIFPRLVAAGTATVSDALDKLGINGACLGIRPVNPGFSLIGRARTVRYAPSGSRKGSVGDYIDDYDEGTVAVLDNSGRMDATVWGDILTEYSAAHQLAGTVIDGVCRDSALCVEVGYPIYSRGVYMRTGKDRVQVEELDGPVTIGGIRVERRDVLIGDGDGVLVIPADRLDEVCDVASSIAETEDRIRADVRGGMRLIDARGLHGYHALQSRPT